MNSNKLELLLKQAAKIEKQCERLPENLPALSLQKSMLESITFCRKADRQAPLIIALIGGTGVGKSFIFSLLAGQPNISPSSSSIRGFTCKPFIAASKSDRHFLPFNDDEAEFIPGFLPNAILIDTPDLDTINENNFRLAQAAISISDVIVCVTTPDKRSDFSISHSILNWASRKRWFFAMNKLDLAEDVSRNDLKNDFFQRLKHMGFTPDDAAIFLFSAKDPACQDFLRLKSAIAASHSQNQSQLFHYQACVKNILHSLHDANAILDINATLVRLKNIRDILAARITATTQNLLSGTATEKAAQDALMENIYSSALGRLTGFLFPYFFVLSKFFNRTNLNSLEHLLKDKIQQSSDIKSCFADEARFLTDNNLQVSQPVAVEQLYAATCAQSFALQIEQNARTIRENRTLGFYIILGNLLPALILIQALYRSLTSWLTGVWLPADFFIHAVFIILGASIPGYLLVNNGLNRLGRSCVVSANTTPENHLVQLNANIASLGAILHEASLLSSECHTELGAIKDQLPDATFGMSQNP